MCGIAFVFDSEKSAVDPGLVKPMVNAIIHRGPDANNVIARKHAALGHARLSIVDIQGGNQPMLSEDGRYSIIFNGEIYNYASLRKRMESQGIEFNTRSDTEVILQLYMNKGVACLQELRGMFSFAIHDDMEGRLFLARDRLGIKPLFYHWDGVRLTGASEAKAIFASGLVEPAIDIFSLANFFKYQFSVSPNTFFQNIVQLEPGNYLLVTAGGKPEIRQYWDLEFPEHGQYEEKTEEQWCKLFENALDDACISHMIGEVPIGAYLSGGIDSATTTYMLNKHYDNELETFTIRFNNVANDESEISRNIATHLGVLNSELVMDDDRQQGYLHDLESALYHLEQPQRVAVDIPHFLLSDLVNNNKYKVVYTGDGADEILAGYDCYRQDYIRQWGNATADMEARNEYYMNHFAQDFAEEFLLMLLKFHEPGVQQQTIDYYGCYPAWHDQWQVLNEVSEELLSDDLRQKVKVNQQMERLIEKIKPSLVDRHSINQSLYIETKTRLVDWILWKSDRLSMAHSVEVRVPFMDHKLVELAAQIPPDLKLNGMDEKYILKKIITPNLPQHPQHFKKRAFYTPIREWFFTKDKIKFLDVYLSTQALKSTGYFNVENVRSYIGQIGACRAPSTADEYYRLMKLEWGLMIVLSVQILHRLYVEKQGICFQSL